MKPVLRSGLFFWLMAGCLLLAGARPARAQGRIKSLPFVYQPDKAEDKYQQRIKQKTLPVDASRFIILSRQAANDYRITLYAADLKKSWEVALPLAAQEDLEAFSHNGQSVLVLTHRQATGNGPQSLYGTLIDLATGQRHPARKLFEAPASRRRIGTALSPDGSKLIAYQYLHQQDQLKAITATIYDGSLNQIQNRTFSFRELSGIQSASVRIDDAGSQYVALITHKATKLSVRRYARGAEEAKVMDIQIGGLFNNQQVYIRDTFFAVCPGNQVYAAAICADDKTGAYHSLKAVRFDFQAGEMKFAPEFLFSPAYLAELNKLDKSGKQAASQLADVYLTDLVLSPDMDLLVVAEKQYQEAPGKPFVAREMHLFGYDSYLNPTWHSVVSKHQTAAPEEGLSGISYRSRVFDNNFHLLTLETLNGKTDLYSRVIDLKTGAATGPKPLGLQVSGKEPMAYLKDFTAWLQEKTLVAVVRPSKKSAALQLRRVILK